MNGEEVTPFLNSLTRDANTMYFDNFFHQTGQGKTADAEFMLENSLYGLPQGSAFTTKGQNTYQAAPAILGHQGYTSAVFHGNTGTSGIETKFINHLVTIISLMQVIMT